MGPLAEGRARRGGGVDGRRAGIREEERRRARTTCGRRAKDPGRARTSYLVFREEDRRARRAAEVLPAVIGALLRALAFPKRMSWDAWLDDGKGAFPFGRPIRWLVALLDGDVVPFAIHALVAGAKGRAGRRRRGTRPTAIASCRAARRAGRSTCASFDDLQATLRAALRDRSTRAERAARIRDGLGARRRVPDGATTTAWSRSGATSSSTRRSWSGRIPEEFRSPARRGAGDGARPSPEVRARSREGGAVARFAAVTDTATAPTRRDRARHGARGGGAAARRARSSSREDRKRPLAERVDDLAGVTFHREPRDLPRQGGADGRARRRHGDGAASCPTDERDDGARGGAPGQGRPDHADGPRVPGAAGRHGRRSTCGAAGRAAQTWRARCAGTTTRSRSRRAAPPRGRARRRRRHASSRAVSLADKLDTLAGYFGLGLVPTGSSDPFGLRRAAQGVVRVLLDFWPDGAGAASARACARWPRRRWRATRARCKRPAADVARDLERVPPRPAALRARRPRLRRRRGGGGAGRARARRARRPARGAAAPAGAAPRARGGHARTSSTWPWPSSAPRTSWARPAARPRWTPALLRARPRSASCTTAVARPAARGRRLRGAAALAGRPARRRWTASSTTCW